MEHASAHHLVIQPGSQSYHSQLPHSKLDKAVNESLDPTPVILSDHVSLYAIITTYGMDGDDE